MSQAQPTQHGAERLAELLRAEFRNIPLEHWGFFFPGAVALWRLVHESRPDLLGELSAGYKTEPWFRGHGANWFTSQLLEVPGVVTQLEALMRHAASQVPRTAWDRGYLQETEVLQFQAGSVEALLGVVTAALPAAGAV